MKVKLKIVIAVLLLTTQTAIASGTDKDNFNDRGIYVVGQMGSGSVNTGFMDDFLGPIRLDDNEGFAGRVGTGYQAFRYLALEGGLALYPTAVRTYDSNQALFGWGDYYGKSKISNIYSADLMAVLRVPLGNYFFIDAGAGIAAIHFYYAAMNALNQNQTQSALQWDAGSTNFVAPKTELRLGVKFNKQTSLFLSTSYIFSVNGNNPQIRNYQPSLSVCSIGLSYSL